MKLVLTTYYAESKHGIGKACLELDEHITISSGSGLARLSLWDGKLYVDVADRTKGEPILKSICLEVIPDVPTIKGSSNG